MRRRGLLSRQPEALGRGCWTAAAVVSFDDLAHDPRAKMRRLFSFLGLDGDVADRIDVEPRNASVAPRSASAGRLTRNPAARLVPRHVTPSGFTPGPKGCSAPTLSRTCRRTLDGRSNRGLRWRSSSDAGIGDVVPRDDATADGVRINHRVSTAGRSEQRSVADEVKAPSTRLSTYGRLVSVPTSRGGTAPTRASTIPLMTARLVTGGAGLAGSVSATPRRAVLEGRR